MSKISEAARTLSKLGAKKGGHARAAKMTAAERSESAAAASQARWMRRSMTADGLPQDQAAILAKLRGPEWVQIRISQGPGGHRKRRAIERLQASKRILVCEWAPLYITICAP